MSLDWIPSELFNIKWTIKIRSRYISYFSQTLIEVEPGLRNHRPMYNHIPGPCPKSWHAARANISGSKCLQCGASRHCCEILFLATSKWFAPWQLITRDLWQAQQLQKRLQFIFMVVKINSNAVQWKWEITRSSAMVTSMIKHSNCLPNLIGTYKVEWATINTFPSIIEKSVFERSLWLSQPYW